MSLLFAGKSLPSPLDVAIKEEDSRVIDFILRISPVTSRRLLGRPFPQAIKDLAGPIPTAFSDDITTEIHWTFSELLHHAEKVRDFILSKKQIEDALLKGEFDTCGSLLTSVESRLGKSWWGLETGLLLAQHKGGLAANRSLLKAYHDEDISPWTRFLASFFSRRAEDEISAEEYDETCAAFSATADEPKNRLRTWAYFRFRLQFPRFDSAEYLPYCLSVEESHSLIDRYVTFVRVLQRVLIDNTHPADERIRETILHAAREIPGDHLKLMAAFLDPGYLGRTDESQLLMDLLHEYTIGEYDSVREKSLAAAQSHVGRFAFYELAAKATIRSRAKLVNPFGVRLVPHRILNCLYHILARDTETTQCMRELHKLSYQHDSMSLGHEMFAFHEQHSEDQKPLRGNRFAAFTATIPTPRLVMAMTKHGEALDYLSNLDALYPGNSAVQLFLSTSRSLSTGRDVLPASGLPNSRLLKYRAYVLESLKQYGSALDAYRELEKTAESNPMLRADATTGQYRCYLELDQVMECAEILAAAAVNNPHLVSPHTLLVVIRRYSDSRENEWLKNMAWPILFSVSQREGYSPQDPELLHDVLDDFLSAWGLRRPSDLRGGDALAELSRPMLVYLLRYLCIPGVLDSSIWYDSQEEVEQERIKICEWLSEVDADGRDAYTSEIAELTSRATIRDLTHKAGQSKIYVDTAGIKSQLPVGFGDRWRRCALYATLSKNLQDGVELLGLADKQAKSMNIAAIDEGFKLFKSLFQELRQSFISSNQYGLDSNLSQRIRHGTLSGEIRAQFEAFGLVTQKDVSGSDYLENVHWLDKLGVTDDDQRRSRVAEAFAVLSRGVDSLVHTVRNRWIQIRGPQKEDGMFDYDFTDDELKAMHQQIVGLPNLDAFTDGVFDQLWRRTERDLERVRVAITERLKQLLYDLLDSCYAAIQSMLAPSETVDLRSDITNCKQQIEYGLDTLSQWFHIDRAQRMPSFQLSVLTDALLQQVAKYCGPYRLQVDKHFTEDRRLVGRLFRPLWDLLFILFDNIAKYAGLDRVPVDLTVCEHDGVLTIQVLNDLGQSVDRNQVMSKVERAKREFDRGDSDLLRSEGGSGFHKIYKIVRYELHCDRYEIALGISDNDRFAATVELPAGEFYDEDSGHRR